MCVDALRHTATRGQSGLGIATPPATGPDRGERATTDDDTRDASGSASARDAGEDVPDTAELLSRAVRGYQGWAYVAPRRDALTQAETADTPPELR